MICRWLSRRRAIAAEVPVEPEPVRSWDYLALTPAQLEDIVWPPEQIRELRQQMGLEEAGPPDPQEEGE